jgi:hypothetical protein
VSPGRHAVRGTPPRNYQICALQAGASGGSVRVARSKAHHGK